MNDPFDHQGWPTLDDWAKAKHPDTKCNVTELARKAKAMLESESQTRLLVIPDEFRKMNQVEWQQLSGLLRYP
jgi:hypothetical protein